MKKEKSLQKLTDNKIKEILLLEQITPDDTKNLTDNERTQLTDILLNKINSLTGIARDEFLNKIEPITTTSTKNQLWEYNHNQITYAISTLMQEYGRMPTVTEIAKKTELSRQTVHKHLKDYKNHPQYLEYAEQFRFMTSKVLARVFKFAVNGDMKAAKLYFDVVGFDNLNKPQQNTLIQNQNNYIQINGTVLSQEAIKQLNPEQLNSIEKIIHSALSH